MYCLVVVCVRMCLTCVLFKFMLIVYCTLCVGCLFVLEVTHAYVSVCTIALAVTSRELSSRVQLSGAKREVSDLSPNV